MEGKIYINGQIGANEGEVGVNLIDVIRQVQGQPLATSYTVYINSEGGYVDVGFDIYDYLKSLTVPVHTVGVGLVASIATVIFMAGVSRKLSKGAQFMIHLPSGEVGGTAEEISNYSQLLKDVENKLIKFYKDQTGLTEEAIRPLLRQETWLNHSDAMDMNFITEQEVEYSMVAKFNNLNTNTNMTAEDKTWIEKKFEEFTALFKGTPKNIMLLDSTGAEIEFPTVEEGQLPVVGDTALVNGQPIEDGEYIMPQLDNAVVVFVGGAITEIKTEEGGEDEEMAKLKEENEALKTQLAEATANAETASAKIATIETEFTNFKASIVAKFETQPQDPTPDATVGTAKSRLEKLKNRNK
jgi:ATP-dependent protease ClpP protease subunit